MRVLYPPRLARIHHDDNTCLVISPLSNEEDRKKARSWAFEVLSWYDKIADARAQRFLCLSHSDSEGAVSIHLGLENTWFGALLYIPSLNLVVSKLSLHWGQEWSGHRGAEGDRVRETFRRMRVSVLPMMSHKCAIYSETESGECGYFFSAAERLAFLECPRSLPFDRPQSICEYL